MNAIERIQSSLKTHVAWLAYYEKTPGAEDLIETKYAGNAEHQRKCIKGYKEALVEIRADKARIAELEAVLCHYKGRVEIIKTNRNEIFDENIKLNTEIRELKARTV